jgi:hypothetical protein
MRGHLKIRIFEMEFLQDNINGRDKLLEKHVLEEKLGEGVEADLYNLSSTQQK